MLYCDKTPKKMNIQLNIYPRQPHLGYFTKVGLPRYFYPDNFTQGNLGKTWVKLGLTYDNPTMGKVTQVYLPWVNLPKVFY